MTIQYITLRTKTQVPQPSRKAMSSNENIMFPWSLEVAAKDGFGAAAWIKDDGSCVSIERNSRGFVAEAHWGGQLSLRARWLWTGDPESSLCVLSEAQGPAAEAMEKVGLEPESKHKRILEIMGAMSMGPGKHAFSPWTEWEQLSNSGLGFSEVAESACNQGPWVGQDNTNRRIR